MTFPAVTARTKKARKWLWISLAALAAAQIYFVRELLAAMIIFSAVFVLGAVAALVIYLVDRASQKTVQWAEPQTARAAQAAAHAARNAMSQAEEFSKRQLRRQRSETAP